MAQEDLNWAARLGRGASDRTQGRAGAHRRGRGGFSWRNGNRGPWSGKICTGRDAPGRAGVGVFNHVKRDICVARPRASKANSETGRGGPPRTRNPWTLRLQGRLVVAGCTGLENTGPWWRNLPTGHAFRHESHAARCFSVDRRVHSRRHRSTRVGLGRGDGLETEGARTPVALPPGGRRGYDGSSWLPRSPSTGDASRSSASAIT